MFMVSIISLSIVFCYFQYPRVKPIVTPRFALSCSETLMGELGSIAKNNGLHIQVGIFLLVVPLSRPEGFSSTLNCDLQFYRSL